LIAQSAAEVPLCVGSLEGAHQARRHGAQDLL